MSNNIVLRDYQDDVIESIKKTKQRGIRRQLVVMSTGLGKSYTIIHMLIEAVREGKRCLVLVDQKDLVKQTKKNIMNMDDSLSVGIERAHKTAKLTDDIVIATVQTLGREGKKRIKRFPQDHFDICWCDEAHKSIAETWFRTLEYFHFGKDSFDQDNLLIGCTATPFRNTGESLKLLYDDIVANYDLCYAIGNGWLVDFELYEVSTDTDLSQYKTQGEFDQAVDNQTRNLQALKAYREIADGDKALVYTASVDHAYTMTELFNQNGIPSAVIEANTPEDERKQILKDYKNGKIKCIFNFATMCVDEYTEILTDEGWTTIDEMSFDHKVANWDNGKIWFKKPDHIEIREREENERLAYIPNSNHDLRVTYLHDMVWKQQHQKGYQKNHVCDIMDKKGIQLPKCGIAQPKKFLPHAQKHISEKEFDRKVTANSYRLRNENGYGFEESKTEAIKRLHERLSLKYKNVKELTNKECEFLGYWLGDGSIWETQDGSTRCNLTQNIEDDNIVKWVDNLLHEINLNWTKHNKNNVIVWNLPRGTGFGPQKRNGFYKYEPYLNKNNVDWLWGLNKKQFEHFILGLFTADGDHKNDIPKLRKSYQRISNSNKEILDTIQAVAVCRGLGTSLTTRERKRNLYQLTVNHYQHYWLGGKTFEYEDEYKPERVWCVTTESSNIITRRNGKVTVTGNTTGIDLPETSALMLLRAVQSKLLITQILGRGLRPSQTAFVDAFSDPEARKKAIDASRKPVCKVIDLYDKVGNQNFAHVPSLFGLHNELKTNKPKKFYKEVVEPLEEVKKEHGIDISQIKDLDDIDLIVKNRKVDIKSLKLDPKIRDFTNREWIEVGQDSYEILYSDDKKALIIEADQTKSELIDKKEWNLLEYDMKDNYTKKLQTFNSLSGAFNIADQYADKQGWNSQFKERAQWMTKGVTEGQLKMLNRFYTYKSGYSKFRLMNERYEDTGIKKIWWKPTHEILDRGMASKLIDHKSNN